MAPLTEIVQRLAAADPEGGWIRGVLEQLEDVHWGALRAPGRLIDGPHAREVNLPDGPLTVPCVVETDTLLMALEDARTSPLPTGTADDPKRHHVSRVIEALWVLARHRAEAAGLDTLPLFGIVVVGGADRPEPHRTTILEGMPHIEREQAEDLYASYWGRISPDALAKTAPASREGGSRQPPPRAETRQRGSSS